MAKKPRNKKKKYLKGGRHKSGYGEWINGNVDITPTRKQKEKDKRKRYESYKDYETTENY